MANQIDERVKPFEVKMGKSIASSIPNSEPSVQAVQTRTYWTALL